MMVDWFLEVSAGNFGENSQSLFLSGYNSAVAQTPIIVSPGGIYRQVRPVVALPLRIQAGGNVNDTALGTGARAVTLKGLNAQGQVITETLTTAGASASATTVGSYLRLLSAEVTSTGTLTSAASYSHAGNIIIESTLAAVWGTIVVDSSLSGAGRAEVAATTIPVGREGYLMSLAWNIENLKIGNLYIYTRGGVLSNAAPYQPKLVIFNRHVTVAQGVVTFNPPIYLAPLTDVVCMATVTLGTAAVSADLNIITRVQE